MCENYVFGKQNDGVTVYFLESCTWCRHLQ